MSWYSDGEDFNEWDPPFCERCTRGFSYDECKRCKKQPEAMGLYLLTVKAWPREDPWHRQPRDGKTVAVVFDRWIPGGRPHIIHGQWWSVRETEVIAWAELPKPYEEEGEQVKRNAASKQQTDKPKRKKASK